MLVSILFCHVCVFLVNYSPNRGYLISSCIAFVQLLLLLKKSIFNTIENENLKGSL